MSRVAYILLPLAVLFLPFLPLSPTLSLPLPLLINNEIPVEEVRRRREKMKSTGRRETAHALLSRWPFVLSRCRNWYAPASPKSTFSSCRFFFLFIDSRCVLPSLFSSTVFFSFFFHRPGLSTAFPTLHVPACAIRSSRDSYRSRSFTSDVEIW